MYSIKIMSAEDLPDSDVGKGFRMVVIGDGGSFEFGHDQKGNPIVTVTLIEYGKPEEYVYFLSGNAYVMSETGKTVATFWARKKVELTIDAADPEPEVTIAMLQKYIMDYARQSFSLGDDPVQTIRVDVITDEESNRGFAWSVEVTPPPGVTVYPPEKVKQMTRNVRDKAYRHNVSTRMKAGWTSEAAMRAEAYLIQ